MTESFLRAYGALPTKEQRLEALQRLVSVLDLDERAAISNAISERTDPLAQLPMELVLRIFSHLPLYQIWSLRSVCTRWYRVLSSPDCLRDAISRWNTHHSTDDGRFVEYGAEDSIENRAEHMKALRCGLPCHTTTFVQDAHKLHKPFANASFHDIGLKGSWITYHSVQMPGDVGPSVSNLVTGESRAILGEAREKFMMSCLTETCAGFLSFRGGLYVLPLSDISKQAHRIQLPSAAVNAIAGHYNVFAMIGRERDYVKDSVALTVYDADKDQLRTFSINISYADDIVLDHRMLVDSCKAVVDVFIFTSARRPGGRNASEKRLSIFHVRSSLNGGLLCTSTQEHWTSPPLASFVMLPPAPTGYRDEFRIQVCRGDDQQTHVCAWIFNSTEGTFCFEETVPKQSVSDESRPQAMSAFWKGQCYRSPSTGNEWYEKALFMNETFMVSHEQKFQSLESRIRVLCFDRQVQLAGGSDSEPQKDEEENGRVASQDV